MCQLGLPEVGMQPNAGVQIGKRGVGELSHKMRRTVPTPPKKRPRAGAQSPSTATETCKRPRAATGEAVATLVDDETDDVTVDTAEDAEEGASISARGNATYSSDDDVPMLQARATAASNRLQIAKRAHEAMTMQSVQADAVTPGRQSSAMVGLQRKDSKASLKAKRFIAATRYQETNNHRDKMQKNLNSPNHSLYEEFEEQVSSVHPYRGTWANFAFWKYLSKEYPFSIKDLWSYSKVLDFVIRQLDGLRDQHTDMLFSTIFNMDELCELLCELLDGETLNVVVDTLRWKMVCPFQSSHSLSVQLYNKVFDAYFDSELATREMFISTDSMCDVRNIIQHVRVVVCAYLEKQKKSHFDYEDLTVLEVSGQLDAAQVFACQFYMSNSWKGRVADGSNTHWSEDDVLDLDIQRSPYTCMAEFTEAFGSLSVWDNEKQYHLTCIQVQGENNGFARRLNVNGADLFDAVNEQISTKSSGGVNGPLLTGRQLYRPHAQHRVLSANTGLDRMKQPNDPLISDPASFHDPPETPHGNKGHGWDIRTIRLWTIEQQRDKLWFELHAFKHHLLGHDGLGIFASCKEVAILVGAVNERVSNLIRTTYMTMKSNWKGHSDRTQNQLGETGILRSWSPLTLTEGRAKTVARNTNTPVELWTHGPDGRWSGNSSRADDNRNQKTTNEPRRFIKLCQFIGCDSIWIPMYCAWQQLMREKGSASDKESLSLRWHAAVKRLNDAGETFCDVLGVLVTLDDASCPDRPPEHVMRGKRSASGQSSEPLKVRSNWYMPPTDSNKRAYIETQRTKQRVRHPQYSMHPDGPPVNITEIYHEYVASVNNVLHLFSEECDDGCLAAIHKLQNTNDALVPPLGNSTTPAAPLDPRLPIFAKQIVKPPQGDGFTDWADSGTTFRQRFANFEPARNGSVLCMRLAELPEHCSEQYIHDGKSERQLYESFVAGKKELLLHDIIQKLLNRYPQAKSTQQLLSVRLHVTRINFLKQEMARIQRLLERHRHCAYLDSDFMTKTLDGTLAKLTPPKRASQHVLVF